MNLTIGILGLGLIGGSIAKGIRRFHPDYQIIAYNHHHDTAKKAQADGILDIAAERVGEEFRTCDIVFLCMPVSYNAEYLNKIKPFLKDTCTLTDVGSVKGNIHCAVESLDLDSHFIGGHPMTGSEQTGYQSSTDHLLENAYYALTPTAKTSIQSLTQLKELITSLKAIPIVLNYSEHDYAVAGISHLPHLIASGLVNLIQQSDSKKETMKTLAAGGFKDITRIASSSPVMWQQICLTNQAYICKIMDQYMAYFSEIRDAVAKQDEAYLYHFFEQAKEYRNSIPNGKTSLLKEIHAIYCDIQDEAGSLAKVASLLASKNLSIKNIGITHSREFQEEVLRVDFYEKDAARSAEQILKESGYRATLCE